MADKKEISFKVLVDQTSAQQFSGVIGQMVRQLDQLTKSIGAASAAMGGLLGGGNIGGSRPISQIINQPNRAGAGGAFATTPAALGGTGSPTKGGSLADIFLKNASAFKGMADSSRAAMQTMTEGLQKAVQASSRNLDQLNAKLDAASANYRKLAASSTGFEGSKVQAGMLTNMADIQVQAATEKDNLTKLKAMGEGGGGVGSFLKANWAKGGMLVGAFGAGVNYADIAARSMRETNLMYSNLGAERGGLVGAAAQNLYNNDYRRLIAERQIYQDPAMRAELNKMGDRGILSNARYGTGVVKAMFGKLITGDLGGVASVWENGAQMMEQERMKDREQMISNVMASNGLDMQKAQAFYDTIGTRSSLARRLGYMYGGRPGALKVGSDRFAYEFERRGLGGQEVGAISAISGIGGEAGAKRYALQAAMMGARGFGGGAQLYGMGLQGMGMDYVQRVIGGMGKTGDMQAIGQLGTGLAGYAANLGYGVNDQSSVLGAAMSSGLYNRTGADIHTTQQIMGGLQSLDRRFTGGIDAYGKAMNLRAVIAGMPNASPYARDFAANMPFTEMSRLVGGGKPNLVEQGLGISGEGLKPVMNMKLQDAVNRYHGTDSTPAGRLASAIRSSGKTTQDFLKTHAGFTEKETMVGLAGIVGGATPDITSDQAIGEMAIMMGRTKSDVRRMTKRAGLGDVIGTAEAKANETQAQRNLKLAEEFATNQSKNASLSNNVADAIKKYSTATENITITVDQLNESMGKLVRTINEDAMHNVREGVKKQSAKHNVGNTHTQGAKHRTK